MQQRNQCEKRKIIRREIKIIRFRKLKNEQK